MTLTHILLYASALLPLLVTIPLRRADIRAQRELLKCKFPSTELEKKAEYASMAFEAGGYGAITLTVIAVVIVYNYLNP